MQIISFNIQSFPFLIKTRSKFIRAEFDNSTLKLIDMTCRHRGGPLTHGSNKDGVISCPWHGMETKVCKIKNINLPHIINEKEIIIAINNFERIIQLPQHKEVIYVRK